MYKDIVDLMKTVVKNDYCIGCGLCASIEGSPLTMQLDENGKYKPIINNEKDNLEISVLSICPFAKENNRESEISKEQFGQIDNIKYDKFLGYYLKSYAGFVIEEDYREKGSSGGMGNWIAAQLLKRDLVDGIIHVKPNESNKVLFSYQISNTPYELSKGAKSKYYPIEMSQVLQFVRENPGNYALIGIPCYLKGVRLLSKEDPIIKERIKFMIGLVCGHLKSDMFAKSIGWQLGIKPNNLKEIDFRKKLKDRPANQYGVEVKGVLNGETVVLGSPSKDLFTTNWGYGLFKYHACEFCDDVLAETSDITVGDAWLPEYLNDSDGTNIVVVRNPVIQEILEENIGKSIHLDEISSQKVYQSQAGGFRHRRDGLSYRLYLKDLNNEWRPNKRVEPSNNFSVKRKKIYELRYFLSIESFKAFREAEKEQNFDVFIKSIYPYIKKYDKLSRVSFTRRVLNKLKREFNKVLNKYID